MRDDAEPALLLDRLDRSLHTHEELHWAFHEEAEEVPLARRHFAAPDHLDAAPIFCLEQVVDALGALHVVVVRDGDHTQPAPLRLL